MRSIHFDFDGALPLARSLWDLASEVEQRLATRTEAAEQALVSWTGGHAKTFKIAMANQQVLTNNTVRTLRDDAEAWASAWSNAMNYENQRRYQEATRWDRYTGAARNSFLPITPPRFVSSPSAPRFSPTGELWHE